MKDTSGKSFDSYRKKSDGSIERSTNRRCTAAPVKTWLDECAFAALGCLTYVNYGTFTGMAEDVYALAAAMLAEKLRREKEAVATTPKEES
jgi:hypothetical protein